MFGRDDFRKVRETHYRRFLGPICSVSHSMPSSTAPQRSVT
jgi:hypothetical protein